MRLCTFEINGCRRIGAKLQEDRIVDLTAAYAALLRARGSQRADEIAACMIAPDMKKFIEGGPPAIEAAQAAVDYVLENPEPKHSRGDRLCFSLAELHLLAPLLNPAKFFAVAINTRQKWEKAEKPSDPRPTYFIKLPTCIAGPFDPVEIPDVGVVGPEVEIAAIVGKKGRNIPIEAAESYIFGFTVHNDITAHEMRKTTEWITVKRKDGSQEKLTYPGRYKNFDTFSPMGPWLVTREEIKDVHALRMTSRLNGELVQEGSSADAVFRLPYMVSYLSQAHTLEPGDIVSGGTVLPAEGWTMFSIDLRRIGGVLESEVEGLGVMKNPIHPV